MEGPVEARCAAAQCDSPLKHMSERVGAQSTRRSFLFRLRDCCRQREGTQLVEFALVAPILFVLLLGIVFLGIGLNNYIILTNAVTTGSRDFALSPGEPTSVTGGDPCTYAATQANNDAMSLNKSLISYTLVWTHNPDTGSSSTNTYTGTGSAPPTCASVVTYLPPSNMTSVKDTVTVTATYPAIMPTVSANKIFVGLGVNAWTLSAHSTQAVQ